MDNRQFLKFLNIMRCQRYNFVLKRPVRLSFYYLCTVNFFKDKYSHKIKLRKSNIIFISKFFWISVSAVCPYDIVYSDRVYRIVIYIYYEKSMMASDTKMHQSDAICSRAGMQSRWKKKVFKTIVLLAVI